MRFCYNFSMIAVIKPHQFSGIVRIPASKSHTIRRLIIAALADGVSALENPLDSLDTRSCVSVCRALGADITEYRTKDAASPNIRDKNGEKLKRWTVRGTGADKAPRPHHFSAGETKRCDVGNSGTTLFLALAAASLGAGPVEFDGDEQIRRRSAGHLLEALAGLGVKVNSAPNGCAPVSVCGPWKGGRVSLPCPTSQYLSALLLAAPLAAAGVVTEIDIPLLNEKPYIEMTLSYLDSQGIPYETARTAERDFSYFRIPGGGEWKPVSGPVPADFSSAAFPGAAAAISGGPVTLLGLDPEDTQGDKAFFGFLENMGCVIQWVKGGTEWRLEISRPGALRGGEFDLNNTPDLLPPLAAVAYFAEGDTALVNVAHARLKETDRIAVMAEELGKLGVKTAERADGLVIHGMGLKQGSGVEGGGTGKRFETNSRGDHRIAMALACAGLGCGSPVEITGAECAAVTYPGFLELLGAEL
jgi:3-phosphoshikimate 1-carboxyvinyltransferase